MTRTRFLSILPLAVLLTACGGDREPGKAAAPAPAPSDDAISAPAPAPEKPAPPLDPADIDADILGVRLGMTADEVIAALQAYKPDWESDPIFNTVEELAGVTRERPTPDTPGAFAPRIMINDRPRENIDVHLAQPPAENRVLRIERNQSSSAFATQNTSLEVYVNALIEKYGEPAERPPQRNPDLAVLKWLYPADGADCNPFKVSGAPMNRKNWPTNPNQFAYPPDQCAAVLVYSVTANDGIVSGIAARLENPGQSYLSQQAAAEYLNQVRADAAEKARQQATDKPVL
ncbi:MAG: hypothetical protein QNJ73_04920 [Gammaproteobacteria bacterium]|nr:hypothetical protein [Gammaproteobacteria bacterium]